jgi:hypothetical protein
MRPARWLPTVVAAAAAAAFTGAAARDAHALPPWVDRPLTLPAGDWAVDTGLGIHHLPAPPGVEQRTGAGINLEMGVGVTDRLELGVRTGLRFGDDTVRGLEGDLYGRLFDRQYVDGADGVLANPELRVRGAVVRGDVLELGLEGRLFVPVEQNDAAVEFGLPMAFHIGHRVRLDTGVFFPLVFTPSPTLAVSAPLDVWIQASPRVWVGPMTGLVFQNVTDSSSRRSIGYPPATDLSLGGGFGYQITRYLDFKAMFLFPEIDHEGQDFGFGAGVQIRVE